MASSPSPQRGGVFVMLATTLLTGLAGGALCCVLALAIKQEPTWLMWPAALAIGAFTRWQDYRGRRGAMVAATATLLCVIYTQYLYAAVRMADMLGFPLRDTLFRMDWRLTWQIVRGNSGVVEVAVLLLAPVIAAAVTVRTARGQ